MLRRAAEDAEDPQRVHTATWLADLFATVTDRAELHHACRAALGLFRGGMGSFRDVEYPGGEHALELLESALRRAL